MSCLQIQNSLSAHLDGCLSESERSEVLAHLGDCPGCVQRLQQLARVRAMLAKLPHAAPPPQVTAALRVMASRQRAKVVARRSAAAYWSGRLRLFVDNLMRPLALPFAGGLVSAMALFSMLVPNIRIQADPRINDTPIAFIYTDPTVKEQAPYEVSYATDVTVEVIVDGEGRAVDYFVPDGVPVTEQLRRQIVSNLLWTQFTPATAYGRPTLGRMFLSFTHTKFEVPSKS